jgi:hypothetical protein
MAGGGLHIMGLFVRRGGWRRVICCHVGIFSSFAVCGASRRAGVLSSSSPHERRSLHLLRCTKKGAFATLQRMTIPRSRHEGADCPALKMLVSSSPCMKSASNPAKPPLSCRTTSVCRPGFSRALPVHGPAASAKSGIVAVIEAAISQVIKTIFRDEPR